MLLCFFASLLLCSSSLLALLTLCTAYTSAPQHTKLLARQTVEDFELDGNGDLDSAQYLMLQRAVNAEQTEPCGRGEP